MGVDLIGERRFIPPSCGVVFREIGASVVARPPQRDVCACVCMCARACGFES